MQYQVPQFIEVEDKIFGPLTFKQMLYIVAGAGASYLIYTLLKGYLPMFVVIVLVIPVAGFAAVLAFYKINNRPFLNALESAVKYMLGGKLYIWKKETKTVQGKDRTASNEGLVVPKLADSRLKDLTWSLDIKQSIDGSSGDSANRTADALQSRRNAAPSAPMQNYNPRSVLRT